jgi:hypothetical protein
MHQCNHERNSEADAESGCEDERHRAHTHLSACGCQTPAWHPPHPEVHARESKQRVGKQRAGGSASSGHAIQNARLLLNNIRIVEALLRINFCSANLMVLSGAHMHTPCMAE